MESPAPRPEPPIRACPAGSRSCEWPRCREEPGHAIAAGMSRREVLRAGAAVELLCCLPGALARTLGFARDQDAATACRYHPRRAPGR